jgi:hypothetical protein
MAGRIVDCRLRESDLEQKSASAFAPKILADIASSAADDHS